MSLSLAMMAGARIHPGLCTKCVHAKVVVSDRGSVFWRCLLADDDSRFPKYPRLPVLECAGFEPPAP